MLIKIFPVFYLVIYLDIVLKMKETFQTEADVQGVGAETLATILDFSYTQKILVGSENALDLYIAADYMQIPCKFIVLLIM